MDVCYKSVILRKFWWFMVCLIITSIYDSANEHTNVQAGNIFIWKEVRVGVFYWNSTSSSGTIITSWYVFFETLMQRSVVCLAILDFTSNRCHSVAALIM